MIVIPANNITQNNTKYTNWSNYLNFHLIIIGFNVFKVTWIKTKTLMSEW